MTDWSDRAAYLLVGQDHQNPRGCAGGAPYDTGDPPSCHRTHDERRVCKVGNGHVARKVCASPYLQRAVRTRLRFADTGDLSVRRLPDAAI